MAEFQEGNFVTVPNTVDLSAEQYSIVKEDAAGKAVLATANTDNILGVLNNAPEAGWGADVAVINGNGSFKVKLGGNVLKDAYLTTNGAGRAITATKAAAGAQPVTRVFGRARSAGSTGEVIEYIRVNELY